MSISNTVIGLDIGEKRIGVAIGDRLVKIASPKMTVEVDGTEIDAITRLVIEESADTIVIGYPRNQSGDKTGQTDSIKRYVEKLKKSMPDKKIVFQDESLTSVIAEQRLKSYNRPYSKGDIDAMAAAIILHDYLET